MVTDGCQGTGVWAGCIGITRSEWGSCGLVEKRDRRDGRSYGSRAASGETRCGSEAVGVGARVTVRVLVRLSCRRRWETRRQPENLEDELDARQDLADDIRL